MIVIKLKNIVGVVRLLLMGCFLFSSYCLVAQDVTAITVPYSMGFEEGEAQKLACWHINEGYDSTKCQEKWVVGNAVKTEGKRSLYISCDEGTTATYDSVWNTTYA